MSGYLLDTQIASDIIEGNRPAVLRRLTALPMDDIAISAVTEAELRYSIARRGRPPALTARVRELLLPVDILDWDRAAAGAYGDFRASCEAGGISLSPLDMMIAAHAVAAGAVLVTRDKAFLRVPAGLLVEDWTQDP